MCKTPQQKQSLSMCTHLIKETLISQTITLHIKTFFGERKTYSLKIPINSQLILIASQILDNLENSKRYCNYRFIFPMGTIKQLNISLTLEQLQIPDQAELIMLVQTTFHFDLKGDGIKLSNNNLTAFKKGDSDYQTALGNIEMNSGSFYWEIKIQKFVDEEDIFIGVAKKDIDLYSQPTNTKQYWGYLCLCARKFGPDGVEDYGFCSRLYDIIGVLLEFKQGLGTLSFYKNGNKCGEAFTDLTGPLYPAVTMFYGEVQVTLDPTAPKPLH